MSPAVVAVALAAAAGACLPAGSGAGRLRRVTESGQRGQAPADRTLFSKRMAARAPSPTTIMQPWFGPASGVAAAVVLVGVTGAGMAAAVAGFALFCAHQWWLARERRAAVHRRRAGLIELCQALAAESSSGAGARDSLTAAARGLPDFEHLGGVAGSPHGDVAQAMRSVGALPGAGGLRRLAACWQVSEQSGGGLAPSVSRLAESLRDDEQVRREVTAQLAGPRATSVLLALLPAFGLLMGATLGVQPLQVLLGSPVGRACLVVGVGLEVAGLFWTRQITRRAEPP